jgi:hypothetical protein
MFSEACNIEIQGAEEKTPGFGRGVARGEVGMEQYGVCH